LADPRAAVCQAARAVDIAEINFNRSGLVKALPGLNIPASMAK
jgi:hypothetical protein